MNLFSKKYPLVKQIEEEDRNQAIELLNYFFRKINSYPLDGIFEVKPRAATKMIDVYLKIRENGKVLFLGVFDENKTLLSMLMGRVEERPYLQEGKIFYIDIAVTKQGQSGKGYMKLLLDSTEEWTKKKKIQILELRTLLDNKEAIEFWKKRGYKDFYIRFRKNI
ncbi:MAG: GNAT family N-acetyltransferase [Leptospiraceae bacterium]|nr:GNAT family N-acetyltransferase [Leptospiraceae bacterium]MCP5512632.1 GNAT family N-acetyltransferase [Leptospiraceae bacterium]